MFDLHPARQALHQLSAQGDFMPTAPLHLGHARFKTLTAYGHLTTRFLNASAWVAARLQKEKKPVWPELLPLLDSAPASLEPFTGLPGEGLFALALTLTGGRRLWSLQPSILPGAATKELLKVWHRVQPDAPANSRLPAPLAIPPLAHAPLWPALLHLQPLQRTWEVPLRRSHLHALTDLLPGAWLLDPTPLPPGSAIPGLELSAWSELTQFESADHDPERHFIISDAWGQSPQPLSPGQSQSWSPLLTTALSLPPHQRQILTELITSPHGYLFALYQKTPTRTDYLGALAAHPPESPTTPWQASRVAR